MGSDMKQREIVAQRHKNCSRGLRTQRQRMTARTQGVQGTNGGPKGELHLKCKWSISSTCRKRRQARVEKIFR